ncbi:hypothetical protein ACFOET_05690 [Parapedobacter deserti]|uniref:Uncharacterized protein n=1 Tax=Parapedobacter deserti TaxID=1912957 RepID=A0ABV7JJZ8_9SPHI
MDKRIIFHLPYKPDPNRISASQIRPFKMLDAFRKIGYRVDVVMGVGKERKKQIKTIQDNIEGGIKYEFVYSESSTMPTLLTEHHHFPTFPLMDFSFWRYCKNHNIRIGLFYRDIHWKFKFYNDQASPLKRIVAKFFYKYDILQYTKLVDVLFLPSLKMKKYIPELKKETISLPPGTLSMKNQFSEPTWCHPIRILYVGGIGGDIYDLTLFIKQVVEYSHIVFTICCRHDDYQKLENPMRETIDRSDNIRVVHKKGDELIDLYKTCDLCCLFVKPTEYWQFAMPAKLFEYISYLKPVLSVENTAVGNFVKKSAIGWAIKFSKEHIKQWMEASKLGPIDSNLKDFQKNLVHVAQTNTWDNRATEVALSLSAVTNRNN